MAQLAPKLWLTQPVPQHLCCQLHRDLLINPVVCKCGCSFCKRCLDVPKRLRRPVTCPIHDIVIDQFFPNDNLSLVVKSINVHCTHGWEWNENKGIWEGENGCGMVMELGKINGHLERDHGVLVEDEVDEGASFVSVHNPMSPQCPNTHLGCNFVASAAAAAEESTLVRVIEAHLALCSYGDGRDTTIASEASHDEGSSPSPFSILKSTLKKGAQKLKTRVRRSVDYVVESKPVQGIMFAYYDAFGKKRRRVESGSDSGGITIPCMGEREHNTPSAPLEGERESFEREREDAVASAETSVPMNVIGFDPSGAQSVDVAEERERDDDEKEREKDEREREEERKKREERERQDSAVMRPRMDTEDEWVVL